MINTLTAKTFELAGGSIMGRDHAVKRRNCQDALAAGRVRAATYGVVSDGCGEGRKSELGATLSAAVIGGAIRTGLERGADIGALWKPAADALHGALAEVLARAAGDDPDGALRFVRDHLLATVLAFVVTADAAIVFAFGDGLYLIDDEVRALDEDNRPTYPAYALLGRPTVPHVFQFGAVSRIGVATDGFDADDLRAVSKAKHPDLSRAMRVRQLDGRFEDDGAIVVATRLEGFASTGDGHSLASAGLRERDVPSAPVVAEPDAVPSADTKEA